MNVQPVESRAFAAVKSAPFLQGSTMRERVTGLVGVVGGNGEFRYLGNQNLDWPERDACKPIRLGPFAPGSGLTSSPAQATFGRRKTIDRKYWWPNQDASRRDAQPIQPIRRSRADRAAIVNCCGVRRKLEPPVTSLRSPLEPQAANSCVMGMVEGAISPSEIPTFGESHAR